MARRECYAAAMSAEDAFQLQMRVVKETGTMVTAATDPDAAKAARAAYRYALELALDLAPSDEMRATLEGLLQSDPKAQP
jgi:hypothetical protein